MMRQTNQAAASIPMAPRWHHRVIRWLFPMIYLEPLPDKEGFVDGDFLIENDVFLDWRDRVRLLVSGHLLVKTRSQADVVVHKLHSKSVSMVLSPWDARIRKSRRVQE